MKTLGGARYVIWIEKGFKAEQYFRADKEEYSGCHETWKLRWFILFYRTCNVGNCWSSSLQFGLRPYSAILVNQAVIGCRPTFPSTAWYTVRWSVMLLTLLSCCVYSTIFFSILQNLPCLWCQVGLIFLNPLSHGNTPQLFTVLYGTTPQLPIVQCVVLPRCLPFSYGAAQNLPLSFIIIQPRCILCWHPKKKNLHCLVWYYPLTSRVSCAGSYFSPRMSVMWYSTTPHCVSFPHIPRLCSLSSALVSPPQGPGCPVLGPHIPPLSCELELHVPPHCLWRWYSTSVSWF